MNLREESSRFGSLRGMILRNLSSSSSAFFSANQSPFFSPRTSICQIPPQFDLPSNISSNVGDLLVSGLEIPNPKPLTNDRFPSSDVSPIPATSISSDFQELNRAASPTGNYNSTPCYGIGSSSDYFRCREQQKKLGQYHGTSYSPTSTSFSPNRLRSCDVYIGFHGWKPLLLGFTNWLRAELEVQGVSCFVTDRARCRNSRKHRIIGRAMDACTFGVVILTSKSFWNPYTI